MTSQEKEKSSFLRKLAVALQIIITSAVTGSVAGFLLPLIQEHRNEERRIETYLTHISTGGFLGVTASRGQTETGSPADNFSVVLGHLWDSAHFDERKLWHETLGDEGSWDSKDSGVYEYCYPSIKTLPSSECVTLDDFNFSDAGLIESFEINDMPVAALISINSDRSESSDRVHGEKENKDFQVYRRSVLMEPGLDKSFISFEMKYTPLTEDAPGYLLLDSAPLLHNRLENNLPGYAIMPSWAYRYENKAPFSIHVENTGSGFAHLCTKRANREHIALGFREAPGERTCRWITL